ncbi:hypothetical protein BB558_006152 [Smittium angustum]|uniref:Uncharacterized protein n=1 Tax=Smittium angustum TaxID=133377 RepID=A0A2U1IYJ2_SMIAN|nr:hypothetical protein BB558_006152 [Smittium angustum]
MKTRRDYRIKKIDKLPFEILSMIFFEAQNPNLSTVSKNFYIAAHDTSTILNCISNWKKQNDQICCYLCTFKKMTKNSDLMLAIFKNNLNYGCSCFSVRDHLIGRILKHGYLNVLKRLLHESKLEQIPTVNSDSLNPTNIYEAKPLININTHNSIDFVFPIPINQNALIMLENAHKISINILDQHNISKKMLFEQKTVVQIHSKLSNGVYNNVLKYSIEKLNFTQTEYILGKCTLSKNSAISLLESAMDTDDIAMFCLVALHPKITKAKTDIDIFDYVLSNRKSNLFFLLIIPSVEKGDVCLINSLLGAALICNSVNAMKLLIEYGADASLLDNENIEIAVDVDSIDALSYYVEYQGFENIKKETRKVLMKSSRSEFKMKLLDLGLSPHFEKDYMLHYALNHLNYFTFGVIKTFDNPIPFIKRLLEAGCDVYGRNSKLLKHAISNRKTKIVKLILEHSKKPHPNLKYQFYNLRTDDPKVSRMLLEHNKNVYPNLGAVMYKHKTSLKMDMINLYLEYGAGKTKPYGTDMVKYAIYKKNIELADSLVYYGTLLDFKDTKVFRDAVSIGCTSVVEKYLENSIKQENLYAMNSYLQVLNLNNKSHRDIIGEGLVQAILYSHFGIYDLLIGFLSEKFPTKKRKVKPKKTTRGRKSQPKVIKVSENVKSISQNLKNDILQQACNLGNVEYARKAIEMGADVNGIEPDTLCKAHVSNRTDIFDFLIENGIEKERIEEYEFIKTCTEGNFDKVKKMISKGIDLNIYDGIILKQAGKSCNIEIINLLLNEGGKPEKIVWNSF